MAGPSQLASLVIVLDVDFVGMATLPPKRDAVLIVHTNTVPASPIALQRFEPVPRRHHEVVEPGRSIEQLQLSLRASPQRLRDPPGCARVSVAEQIGCSLVTERLNHTRARLHVCHVIRQEGRAAQSARATCCRSVNSDQDKVVLLTEQ